MKKLYKGTVVIIDDEIGKKDPINNVVDHLKKNGCPCATFDGIPKKTNEFVTHLHSVAFLIIDWNLSPNLPLGMKRPADAHIPIIDLLKKIKKKLFIPVFIFTKEDTDDVKEELEKAKLLNKKDESKSFILVKDKSEIMGNKLYDEIAHFTKKSTAIYVLKKWELSYQQAKSKLFCELYNKSQSWPRILWEIYAADTNFPGQGLSDVIAKNISSRMASVRFGSTYIKKTKDTKDIDTLKNILEKTKFIKDIDGKSICPGDVYTSPSEKDEYLINIGGPCDTIPGRKKGGKIIETDDIELHLLRGYKAINFTRDNFSPNKKTNKEQTEIEISHIKDIPSNRYFFIPLVLDGKLLEIDLRSFCIKKFSEIGERVGRITEPHINKLQTAFIQHMFHIQRSGLPSILKEILEDYAEEIQESKKQEE